MEDELIRTVDYGLSLGASYVEIRGEELMETSLEIEDERVRAVKQGVDRGFSIRVISSGAWGFASTSSLERLREACTSAVKLATAASRAVKESVELADVEASVDRVYVKADENPADVEIDDKIEMFLKLGRAIFSSSDRIKSFNFSYSDVYGKKWYFNSDGARIVQDVLYVWGRAVATAKEGSIYATYREELGSIKGFKVWRENPPDELAERISRALLEQLDAVTPKGGVFPVVMGPNVTGVLVHEAFGHLAEADSALAGGLLLCKLGEKVASPLVNIFDDATIEGGFGSFRYDDEGVKAQKSVIVKEGRVVGLMYDRETAAKIQKMVDRLHLKVDEEFNTKPTGNARAESFRVPPLVRMRNTCIAPGDWTLEEMIEDLSFGYLLESFRGGQANLDGTFQVGVQRAYEVVNGEVGRPVRNLSISGNTLETLMHVDAVGNDFKLNVGWCGKGQTVNVGDGGPHIRCSRMLVGGMRVE
ncbi:MAG: TldD/PmbA family protein [Candidatus Jordarchaeales archaeon]|nr:TldD/PmbA family protein [Candidatus Jordarchaeia archaeon]